MPLELAGPQALYPPSMPIGQLPYWGKHIGILSRSEPLEVAFRESDEWSLCVQRFAASLPRGVRSRVGEALVPYDTTCANGPLAFHPARRDGTYLGLAGTLTRDTRELALEVAYKGDALEPDHVTLIADGVRWTSPRLDFDDHVAHVPFTRDVRRAVMRLLDANDAVVRFENQHAFEDVPLGEERRQELRALIDALDSI